MPDTGVERARIQQAGRYQAEAYLAGRPLDLMQQHFAPTTQDAAYRVQQKFIERLSQTRGSLGGYKIAYTSAVMRESRGISAPCSGRIFASTITRSPAALNSADYVKLAIECEVGVRLASQVPASGAPYTRGSIAPHIESLMTAFEIVDMRPAGAPDGADPAVSSIVTNISNGGAVLGREVRDWQGIDLAASRGTMTINGVQVGEGHGSDVMGHPLEALVWLANQLAARGESIPAGAIVITGSIIPPTPLNAGDTATISIEGLGDAQIKVS
jgi:2-oxo-3-hexenedioate decarboxylase/2-keto-4-pentenoate hydratase